MMKLSHIVSGIKSRFAIEQAKNRFAQKDYDGALKELKTLVKAQPDFELPPGLSHDLQMIFGMALEETGHYERAVQIYRAIMSVDPSYLESARIHIGCTYSKMGEFDAAIREWEELLDERPNCMRAYELIREMRNMPEQTKKAILAFAAVRRSLSSQKD